MGQVNARVLKGFRDYLPEHEIPRQQMLRKVIGVFESFGFSPLMTPALEYSEVLLGKYGDEGDKLLYRFEDNGKRDVALRYDLTVPLARVVAQHGHLVKPFRRYHIAPVWRAEKPGKGRFREFMQCDVDIVGEPNVRADLECMMVGLEVLAALDVPGYMMRVNNRKILDGMLDALGIDTRDRRHAVLRCIDKLEKIGREGVAAELSREAELALADIEHIFAFMSRSVDGPEAVRALGEDFAEGSRGRLGTDELAQLLDDARSAGYGDRVQVDLSIARGLDYYTGTIYETFVTGHENFGSVMSGGRYDTLLGMFLKQSLPAVGISLGVDRLLALLQELELVHTRESVADICLTLLDEGGFGWLTRVAQQLRRAGFSVEQVLSPSKLGKQFKRAHRRGCRWVIVAGPDERDAGQVAVKELETGTQHEVPVGELVAWFRNQSE